MRLKINSFFLLLFIFSFFKSQEYFDRDKYAIFLDAKTNDIKIIENDSIVYTNGFNKPQKLIKTNYPEKLCVYQYDFIIHNKNYFVNNLNQLFPLIEIQPENIKTIMKQVGSCSNDVFCKMLESQDNLNFFLKKCEEKFTLLSPEYSIIFDGFKDKITNIQNNTQEVTNRQIVQGITLDSLITWDHLFYKDLKLAWTGLDVQSINADLMIQITQSPVHAENFLFNYPSDKNFLVRVVEQLLQIVNL